MLTHHGVVRGLVQWCRQCSGMPRQLSTAPTLATGASLPASDSLQQSGAPTKRLSLYQAVNDALGVALEQNPK